VERDVERLLERLAPPKVVPAEQLRHDEEMAARGDREELREALHDPEDDGMES
jgi:hypothetical protein